MSDGLPRDERGLRVCGWCGEPIRNQPATGRLRDYCKQGHREMAYRARRESGLIAAAVADALAARDSSTDDARSGGAASADPSVSSTDETARRSPRRTLGLPGGAEQPSLLD
ncbi:hypothetical protein [Streptomyces sp. NPDC088910]|uniref:hypothetical protein n=1 Tax=unclassified Streptomyces TaxID=2593676 RepID=UPI003822FC72